MKKLTPEKKCCSSSFVTSSYDLSKSFSLSNKLSVLLQALDKDQKARVLAASKQCQKQTGASEELILKTRKGEYADDPKLKEHLLCFAKKLGFINEEGEIQADAIKARGSGDIPADILQQATDKCAGLTADTLQQTIFDVLKCYSKATSARFTFT